LLPRRTLGSKAGCLSSALEHKSAQHAPGRACRPGWISSCPFAGVAGGVSGDSWALRPPEASPGPAPSARHPITGVGFWGHGDWDALLQRFPQLRHATPTCVMSAALTLRFRLGEAVLGPCYRYFPRYFTCSSSYQRATRDDSGDGPWQPPAVPPQADTVYALSSGQGTSAVAVIRLTGPGSGKLPSTVAHISSEAGLSLTGLKCAPSHLKSS